MIPFAKSVLSNLMGKYATRLHPFEVRPNFPAYRGHLVNDINTCIFCGLCASKCPAQCLAVDKKERTWDCDTMVCVYCGICADVCPVDSLSLPNTYNEPSYTRTNIHLQGPPKPEKEKPAKEAAPAEAAAPAPTPEAPGQAPLPPKSGKKGKK